MFVMVYIAEIPRQHPVAMGCKSAQSVRTRDTSPSHFPLMAFKTISDVIPASKKS